MSTLACPESLMPYWVVRRVLAIALTLAVPAGTVWAPFLHAHTDEDHHATAVHAHFGGHAHHHATHEREHGPTLHEREDERAIYLDALVAVDPPTVALVATSTPVFQPVAPPERPAHVSVEVTHGHDPPLANQLDSRPPPDRLS